MHIWSDYGDEITFDKGQKLSKWCASGRVSQRLSMKERGVKVLKNKKKKKKDRLKSEKQKSRGLYSRESEAQLALQAMAHSERYLNTIINGLSVCQCVEIIKGPEAINT